MRVFALRQNTCLPRCTHFKPMVVPLAMENGEICTGQIILQPIFLKSDRLLASSAAIYAFILTEQVTTRQSATFTLMPATSGRNLSKHSGISSTGNSRRILLLTNRLDRIGPYAIRRRCACWGTMTSHESTAAQ